eukprot:jgi/Chrzof1/14784/Cz09g16030.t1
MLLCVLQTLVLGVVSCVNHQVAQKNQFNGSMALSNDANLDSVEIKERPQPIAQGPRLAVVQLVVAYNKALAIHAGRDDKL